MLRCAYCGSELAYVHGHGACVRAECPMRGVNQAECCSGEQGCPPTSAIARAPAPPPRDDEPGSGITS